LRKKKSELKKENTAYQLKPPVGVGMEKNQGVANPGRPLSRSFD